MTNLMLHANSHFTAVNVTNFTRKICLCSLRVLQGSCPARGNPTFLMAGNLQRCSRRPSWTLYAAPAASAVEPLVVVHRSEGGGGGGDGSASGRISGGGRKGCSVEEQALPAEQLCRTVVRSCSTHCNCSLPLPTIIYRVSHQSLSGCYHFLPLAWEIWTLIG